PVDAGFMHAFNDAFIFISSASLEAEIEVFSEALGLQSKSIRRPENFQEVESVVEQLSSLLSENVLPPQCLFLGEQLSGLDEHSKQLIQYRMKQLSAVIESNRNCRYGDTYVVSPSWCRRWLDLIACRLLHADVICFDLDACQP
ncbi:MAG: hypothetical protein WD177_05000, partial [Methylophaga sp.]